MLLMHFLHFYLKNNAIFRHIVNFSVFDLFSLQSENDSKQEAPNVRLILCTQIQHNTNTDWISSQLFAVLDERPLLSGIS